MREVQEFLHGAWQKTEAAQSIIENERTRQAELREEIDRLEKLQRKLGAAIAIMFFLCVPVPILPGALILPWIIVYGSAWGEKAPINVLIGVYVGLVFGMWAARSVYGIELKNLKSKLAPPPPL